MKRLIAIGDIHGHNKTLQALLADIKPTEEDEFVFLGDYYDRGPDSKGVIDTLLDLNSKHNCKFIMGNHEEMVLAAVKSKSEFKFWLNFGGRESLGSYGLGVSYIVSRWRLDLKDLPIQHVHFLGMTLVEYYETEDYIFVHACYHPDYEMRKQTSANLRWVKLPNDIKPHYSGKKIYCGHTPSHDIVDRGHICCIDTGAGIYNSGKLTAIDALTGKTWQHDTRNTK